jgi:hypothetical protein
MISPSGGQPLGPGRPIGRPGVGFSHGVFGVFSYYQLIILFLNMVCLTVALAVDKQMLQTESGTGGSGNGPGGLCNEMVHSPCGW